MSYGPRSSDKPYCSHLHARPRGSPAAANVARCERDGEAVQDDRVAPADLAEERVRECAVRRPAAPHGLPRYHAGRRVQVEPPHFDAASSTRLVSIALASPGARGLPRPACDLAPPPSCPNGGVQEWSRRTTGGPLTVRAMCRSTLDCANHWGSSRVNHGSPVDPLLRVVRGQMSRGLRSGKALLRPQRWCLGRRREAGLEFATPADVAELVDAHGSGPCGGEPRGGSSPLIRIANLLGPRRVKRGLARSRPGIATEGMRRLERPNSEHHERRAKEAVFGLVSHRICVTPGP